jgi:GT2 family glycosyltransferase
MQIKLSVVIGVLNKFELFEEAFLSMYKNLAVPEDVEFILIDNGSDIPLQGFMPTRIAEVSEAHKYLGNLRVVRNEVNTGNYPMFKQGLDLAEGEVIAFLHSDLIIKQQGWDQAVLAQFDGHSDLGLLGFLGSTEIDRFGGRGSGTTSNMVKHGDQSSEAEAHGKRSAGMTIDGSVVDGLAMIFRKSAMQKIEHKTDFPPHHFYDRMMCCQIVDAGYRVGILGVKFAHLNGQTANSAEGWQNTAREWCRVNLGIESPTEWVKLHPDWFKSMSNPSRGHVPNGLDHVIYLEAEYRFLKEFRDEKHLVPLVFGKRI